MSARPDRRRDRSQRALTDSLMSLLQELDWAEITVKALCDRADVARATFYARFDSKQDLLDALFRLTEDDIRASLVRSDTSGQTLPILHWLVRHSHEGRSFHRRIRGSTAGLVIQARFRQTVGTLLAEDLARSGLTLGPLSLAMVQGAAFAAIEHWLALPLDQAGSPEEMTQRLGELLHAMVRGMHPEHRDESQLHLGYRPA